MKRLFILLIFLSFGITTCFSQILSQDKKFSPNQLQEDFNKLKHLIVDVHVNPNWELNPQEFEQMFKHIEATLKDSMTATDFLKQIKPIIASLSDEHSQIYLQPELLTKSFQNEGIYPPFTLIKKENNYFIKDILIDNNNLKVGQQIKEINNVKIEKLIAHCELDTIGFPKQRSDIALKQFGHLYPWASSKETTTFTIKIADNKAVLVKGTTLKTWEEYLNKQPQGKGTNCEERISYARYGSVGYINACWFDVKSKGKFSMDSIRYKIDGIFKKIHDDGIKKLVIDVSKNGGGNSAVGEYLISSFYDKPYKDYQVDFKKSEEYLKLYESWGFRNPAYSAAKNGEILHYGPTMVTPENVPYRFNGKVTIVMGQPTFSSAMTFVTLIKDNQIAPIIGQTSLNGHPTGLGEQFYTKLPNTKIFVRLSVKEFIRPAGKAEDNVLHPDVILTDAQLSSVNEIIKNIN